MKNKKKVLVISPGIPYPPIDGHKLKIYNMLNLLSIDFEVHLIVVTNEKLSKESANYLENNIFSYNIFRYSKIRFLLNIVKGVFKKAYPFQVTYFTFSKVKNFIKKTADEYDYVFLNLIRTAGYFNLFKPEKVVVDMVDSIGINYLRSRKKTSSFIFKEIYKIEASRLIKFEKYIVSNAKLSLFVNNVEAAYYSKYGEVKWLPNGVNKSLLDFKYNNPDYQNCICFFGAMFYQPNIDAALWFIKNVLPHLDRSIMFYIIGPRPSNKILKVAETNKNVLVTGFIDNPYEILQSSLCNVAPMQTGGGIQNKILESMGLGQILITNNLGANPIVGAINADNILIANTPNEFINLINSIIEDRKPFERIGENAKELIKNNYSWENYQKQLVEFLT